jgi:hypothetical protein
VAGIDRSTILPHKTADGVSFHIKCYLQIGGSRSCTTKYAVLLGCCVVKTGKRLPAFLRNEAPSPSGDPEDEGTTIFRNVGNRLLSHNA